MKNYCILEGLFLLMLALLFVIKSVASEKLTIATSPQTAQMYINGAQSGKDKAEIKNRKNDYIAVKVKQEKQNQH